MNRDARGRGRVDFKGRQRPQEKAKGNDEKQEWMLLVFCFCDGDAPSPPIPHTPSHSRFPLVRHPLHPPFRAPSPIHRPHLSLSPLSPSTVASPSPSPQPPPEPILGGGKLDYMFYIYIHVYICMCIYANIFMFYALRDTPANPSDGNSLYNYLKEGSLT